jgi:DNA-binding GntR family transcriptional regulator
VPLVDVLRTAIIHGELSPGQRLVELDLAAQFEASRGAVREALVLLENEGLVTRQRNRGATVRPVSLREAIEITEVRAVVEGLCARKAATALKASDKRRLIQLGEEMRTAVDAGDIAAYNVGSQESHHAIRELAQQATATDVLDRLRYQSVRYQYGITLLPGRVQDGLTEHLAVIDAVVSGDPDQAEAQMRSHLMSVIAALTRLGNYGGLPAGMLGHVS